MRTPIPISKQTISLIRKEFLLDIRNKASLGGVLLYAIAVVYISYMALRNEETTYGSWTALVWVILCFVSLNSVWRSFSADGREMHLYLYTLADPRAIILSKILYNLIVTAVITGITFVVFLFLIGLPEKGEYRPYELMLLTLTGTAGFSSILTMVSAISARSNNNPGLMAILGLPLLLPLIITLVPLSIEIIDPQLLPDYAMLPVPFALNVLAAALGYLLFPYLWRD